MGRAHGFVAGLALLLVPLGCDDGALLPGLDGSACVTPWGRGPTVRIYPSPSYEYEPRQDAATVISVSPWSVRLDGGSTFELEGLLPDIPLGARVYVQLETHRFPLSGTGSRLSVYSLREREAPGTLALALWSGASPFATGDFGTLSYAYEPTDTPLCGDSCITRTAMAARFSDGGAGALIEGRGRAGPYSVHAVGERREVIGGCNFDSPLAYYEGLVTRAGLAFDVDPTVVDCAAFARDDCLEQAPCALFGGADGTGYRCAHAVGPCEAISDRVACAGRAGCLWTPGDCYCPEGDECACAGGTPPGCRTACETWSACDPEDRRYCEALAPPDASCGPAPGWCALRGRGDCEAEDRRVCTCTGFDGRARYSRFTNSCDRVEAGYPYVVTGTICGP